MLVKLLLAYVVVKDFERSTDGDQREFVFLYDENFGKDRDRRRRQTPKLEEQFRRLNANTGELITIHAPAEYRTLFTRQQNEEVPSPESEHASVDELQLLIMKTVKESISRMKAIVDGQQHQQLNEDSFEFSLDSINAINQRQRDDGFGFAPQRDQLAAFVLELRRRPFIGPSLFNKPSIVNHLYETIQNADRFDDERKMFKIYQRQWSTPTTANIAGDDCL